MWNEGNRYYDIRRWGEPEKYFNSEAFVTLNSRVMNPTVEEFYQLQPYPLELQWGNHLALLPYNHCEVATHDFELSNERSYNFIVPTPSWESYRTGGTGLGEEDAYELWGISPRAVCTNDDYSQIKDTRYLFLSRDNWDKPIRYTILPASEAISFLGDNDSPLPDGILSFETGQSIEFIPKTNVFNISIEMYAYNDCPELTLDNNAAKEALRGKDKSKYYTAVIRMDIDAKNVRYEPYMLVRLVKTEFSFAESGVVDVDPDFDNSILRIPFGINVNHFSPFSEDVEVTLNLATEELFDEMNASAGLEAVLAPAEAIGRLVVDENTEYELTPGLNTIKINRTGNPFFSSVLEIDYSKCPKGKTIAIPVKIESVGMNVDISDTESSVLYTFTPDVYKSYSTNDQERSEGPLKNLFDGNTGTFFHSTWSETPNHDSEYGVYVDVEFYDEHHELSFDFTTRSSGNAGAPEEVDLYTSADGITWNKLAEIRDMTTVLTGGGVTGHWGVYSSETPFRYVRFAVIRSRAGILTEENSAFFNGAELKYTVD